MAADVTIARELQSLRGELSDAQRARAAAPEGGSGSADSPAAPPKETPEDHELGDQLRQLVAEVTAFFEEAEKTISAHPAQSVIGALVVGIVIGRLLARR